MDCHPSALSLGIRDVIGAWIVCLAVAAGFFSPPLVGAAWHAPLTVRRAAASGPAVAAPIEVCARMPHQRRADRANAPRAA